MNFPSFVALLLETPDPLVLLEGRREITAAQAAAATRFAAFLAKRFSRLRFRSGNATGSDLAFAEGVAGVDATRLELVLPYATHRSNQVPPGATTTAWEESPAAAQGVIADATVEASPRARGMVERWQQPRFGIKARYLLRDTMKVTGVPGSLVAPCAAFFMIDPTDPDAGGTGHTIRVCKRQRVPVILQTEWLTWETQPDRPPA